MIIVQNQDEVLGDGSDFIKQCGENRFKGWRLQLGSLQGIQYAVPRIWRYSLQSRNEVGQKTDWITIAFIQRQPGGWSFTISQPFADQCRFPKASRSRDESQKRRPSFRRSMRRGRKTRS